MGTFYSMEVIEATRRHPRRVRVRNRHTGEYYFRGFPVGTQGVPIAKQLAHRVYEIATSPQLRPRVLWYDAKLEILFFELIPQE